MFGTPSEHRKGEVSRMPVCPVGSACSVLSSLFLWRLEIPGAGELRGGRGQATQTQRMVGWGELGLGARPRAGPDGGGSVFSESRSFHSSRRLGSAPALT